MGGVGKKARVLGAILVALAGTAVLAWRSVAAPDLPPREPRVVLAEEPQGAAEAPEEVETDSPADDDELEVAEPSRVDLGDEPVAIDTAHGSGVPRPGHVAPPELSSPPAVTGSVELANTDRESQSKKRAERKRKAAEKKREEREALGRARRRVSIEMYSTRHCGHCTRARLFLNQSGLSYRDHDIDTDSAAERRMRSLNPRGGVPTFDIDGEIVVGFSSKRLSWVIDKQARRRMNRF